MLVSPIVGRWFAPLLLVLAGCLSPTLPLPPPDAPDQVAQNSVDPGTWIVRGVCEPGAVVLVKDDATGLIYGVEDGRHTGRYSVSIAAKLCDRAEVWELVGQEASPAAGFVVEPTADGVPAANACPATPP